MLIPRLFIKQIASIKLPSLALVMVLALQMFAPGDVVAATAKVTCNNKVMNIVAHPDDDLLFQNPDLIRDIVNGRCVRTVFVTAGDAGQGTGRGATRESGIMAAYAKMSGVSNSWKKSDAGISGHLIPVYTLSGKPNVSVVFMRLPDGNGDGTGFGSAAESLQKLWLGSIATIHAIDNSTSYTKQDLIGTLIALMNNFQPTIIHSQDYNGAFDSDTSHSYGDHSDHHASANFTRAAHMKYGLLHTLTGYQGYGTKFKLENVFLADLTAKKNAFYAYASYDQVCGSSPSDATCQGSEYSLWLPRQYTIGSEVGPTTNLAAQASVMASSENLYDGQLAIKAIDGIAAENPVDNNKEWVTANGKAGSWLSLSWSSPKIVSRVVLYDRPNFYEQVTGVTITFDGISSIITGPLNNDGSGVTLTFPPKSVTKLEITINSVSDSTTNVGLAEVEVF